MYNNLDSQKGDPIMETYFNFPWRHKENYLSRKTRAKGHLDTEFMFDETNPAAALHINLYAEHELTKEESSWIQDILLNGQTLWIYKNFGDEKLATQGSMQLREC